MVRSIEAVDSTHLHYLSSAELVCKTRPGRSGELRHPVLRHRHGHVDRREQVPRHLRRALHDRRGRRGSARTINNANVLCIASKYGFVLNRAIIDAFVGSAYTGRKLEELEYITQLEGTTSFMPLDAAAAAPQPLRTGLGGQRRIA